MSSRNKTVRIVVVDDHPVVRERLAEAIADEPGWSVCGEADSHRQALEVIAATRPDLAIIDLSLRDSHGLDLIRDLHRRQPRLLMLVFSMYEGALHAERALRAGARGYLTKQEATRKIVPAIRQVLRGEIHLSNTLSAQITAQMVGKRQRQTSGLDRLTGRELQVLELIGRGHPMRQVAASLQLSVKTVETFRARLKKKLALKDATEVRKYAIEWLHGGGRL